MNPRSKHRCAKPHGSLARLCQQSSFKIQASHRDERDRRICPLLPGAPCLELGIPPRILLPNALLRHVGNAPRSNSASTEAPGGGGRLLGRLAQGSPRVPSDDIDFGRQIARHLEADFLLANLRLVPDLHDFLHLFGKALSPISILDMGIHANKRQSRCRFMS